MSKINYLRIFTLLQIICCYLFFYTTKGLIYINNNEYDFVNNLKSSGGEDNVFVIPIGFIYIILFLILLIKKWSNKTLLLFSLIFIFFQTLCIFIIQMGDIAMTIIKEHNYYLLYIILYPITVVLTLFADKISNKIRNKFRIGEL